MKTAVTNLRMPEEDWMKVKAAAANLGISANEYIKTIIDDATRREFFAYKDNPPAPRKGTRFYESLWQIIEKPSKSTPMGASEEDKAIYGV